MNNNNNNEHSMDVDITEDEAALYDRQIRLWGIESQKRLRNSKILMIGMDGLGAEICKNIVLAGIKALTIVDTQQVTAEDFTSQFLISRQDIGKNRAEASICSLHSLNPQVHLQARDEIPTDQELAQFDVVCMSSPDPQKLIQLDKLCRSLGPKFYCGFTWGTFAFGFLDLQHHSYVIEVANSQTKEVDLEGYTTEDGEIDNQDQVVEKVLDYVSLQKALELKVGGKSGYGLNSRTSPLFFLLHVLLNFYKKFDRTPSLSSQEQDLEELKKIKDSTLQGLGADTSKLTEEHLEVVFGTLSPVCAIAGGVLAQEIIKGVSGKDAPIKNFFLFDGEEGCGIVEAIGTK